MNKNQAANDRCAELFLNNYFYERFRTGSELCSLELIFTPQCNLKCSYCYLWKNEKALFSNCRASKETILHNLELVLKWLEKNKFHPNLDIFSGEFFAQSIGYEALELIYEYQSRWEPELRSKFIIIPTNMTFLCSDELTARVDALRDKFTSIGVEMVLSASIDGKYIETNRTYDASLDIPIDVVRDDAYYEKVFQYCKKHTIYFHPMIYSKHIEKWKDNYLWFKKHITEMDWNPFRCVYLLEVRNEEWTMQDIKHFQEFVEFLYEELWEFCGHDKEVFTKCLIDRNHNLNILGNFLYQNPARYACSLQNSLCMRLDDLSMPPCHRTGYEHFIYGKFVPDDEQILKFVSQRVELMVTINGMGQASLPYCTECPINQICLGQCLGAMYESNKNLLTPIPTVCALEHAKLATAMQCLEKYDVFDNLRRYIAVEKVFQLEQLREAF